MLADALRTTAPCLGWPSSECTACIGGTWSRNSPGVAELDVLPSDELQHSQHVLLPGVNMGRNPFKDSLDYR
jgi:hypothetical protein